MAAIYPVHEFAEVVALLVGAANEDADLSTVRINRSDRGLHVTFETRTPRAFLGAKRTRATALRNAVSEKLGDTELRLAVLYPGPSRDEAAPHAANDWHYGSRLFEEREDDPRWLIREAMRRAVDIRDKVDDEPLGARGVMLVEVLNALSDSLGYDTYGDIWSDWDC